MLVGTTDDHTKKLAAQILLDKVGVQPCADFQGVLWVDPNTFEIDWVVGYTGFLGKTCQMHMVKLRKDKYTPRKLIWAAFDYPFNQLGLEVVFGVLNSNNRAAVKYDRHLGFKEVQRFEGVHDHDGDMILMAMNKADCRWIKESKDEDRMVA
jgi:hypothetical protein